MSFSPKYGVNPGMICCLYCGEAREIALYGRIRSKKYARDDIEAPHSTIQDYIPCEKCAEKLDKYNKGIAIAFKEADGRKVYVHNSLVTFAIKHPENGKTLVPTGRYQLLPLVEKPPQGKFALLFLEEDEDFLKVYNNLPQEEKDLQKLAEVKEDKTEE